jgi:hypothetical protein
MPIHVTEARAEAATGCAAVSDTGYRFQDFVVRRDPPAPHLANAASRFLCSHW